MIEFAPGTYRKLIRNLWRYSLIGIVMLILYVVAVSYNFLWLFGGMPSLKALENPKSEEASEVYTADNQLLGKYYVENRTPIEISQVSPNVTSALLATEDARFVKHAGIDPRSLFRAISGFVTFRDASSSGGGSTLTQQTAKNLFDTRQEELRGVLGQYSHHWAGDCQNQRMDSGRAAGAKLHQAGGHDDVPQHGFVWQQHLRH